DNTIGQALRDNKVELGKWGDLLYTTGSMAAAGLVAYNTGHDGATAATVAQNAAVNNYLWSHEVDEWLQASRTCKGQGGSGAACDRAIALGGSLDEIIGGKLWELSKMRDAALISACRGTNVQLCQGLRREANDAQVSVSDGVSLARLLMARDRATAYGVEYGRTNNALYLASGWTPEQIARLNGWIGLVVNTAADVTPVAGDYKAFVEANSSMDYFLAVLGVAGIGDIVKVGGKIADAVKAAKAAKAAEAAKDLEKVVAKLSQGQQKAINKIDNIANNFKPESDISGLLADMSGTPISKGSGKYWNHYKEMEDVLKGLRNHVKTLDGVNDSTAQAARQKGLDIIRHIESAMQGYGI
ncbi:MAG: hypothetical protein LBI92_02525, partial [Azoarcus sp.]|nr:hypothetical protein [Azoarcus sp.]